MLPSGFPEDSARRALDMHLDFIGADCGSTDAGPYALGSGDPSVSREAVKNGVEILLSGAREKDIPLIIGSAGYAGAEDHLKWFLKILEQVTKENNLHYKLAIIHSEQNKNYLKNKLKEGKIKPLNPYGFKGPAFESLNEETIDKCDHIVGVMGVEPYIKALEEGAEVIIAGRSTDTAIYSAIPLQNGFPPGIVWHAAKIAECGAACVEHRTESDSIVVRIQKDGAIFEPPNPKLRCTPLSVRSHMLYENPSPIKLYEPSGMVDTSKSKYEAVSDRAVKITGSEFVPAKTYTIKLEGSGKIGYRSIWIGGIRDSVLISSIDDFMQRVRATMEKKVGQVYEGKLLRKDWQLNYRVYGKNAVMGPLEPEKDIKSHEIGVLAEVIAPDQDTAYNIAYLYRHTAMHQHYGRFSGLTTNFAFPFVPLQLNAGPVYKFFLNHLVQPNDPYEMFPTEYNET